MMARNAPDAWHEKDYQFNMDFSLSHTPDLQSKSVVKILPSCSGVFNVRKK